MSVIEICYQWLLIVKFMALFVVKESGIYRCAIITDLHHCVFQEHVGIAAVTPEVSTLTTRATSPVATTTSVTVDQCTTARVD